MLFVTVLPTNRLKYVECGIKLSVCKALVHSKVGIYSNKKVEFRCALIEREDGCSNTETAAARSRESLSRHTFCYLSSNDHDGLAPPCIISILPRDFELIRPPPSSRACAVGGDPPSHLAANVVIVRVVRSSSESSSSSPSCRESFSIVLPCDGRATMERNRVVVVVVHVGGEGLR